MGKNFTAAFAVCLLVSALPLACGDDEEGGDGGGGKGGTGGTTGGSSGASGSSGKGGMSGTGGTGGRATGGTGGRTGGTGGMTGGTAGIDMGGAGGDEGGMGGEGGGGVEMTLCERFCAAGDVANCTNTGANCITSCEQTIEYGNSIDPSCEALFTTYYECSIDGTPADWACNQGQPSYAGTECVDESMAVNDAFCFG
jgi:hypothetical protein